MTYEELKERNRKYAFTLPEMLLAAVVVGILAAITIPAMVSRKDRREWISSLNKCYSTLSEGFKQAEAINGSVRLWGDNFVNYLIDGFRVINKCEDNDCIKDVRYLNGEDLVISETASTYVITDGQILTLNLLDKDCTAAIGNLEGVCGTAYIDVNGKKGPNVWGKDYFGFYVTREGILPFGSQKIDVLESGFSWVPKGCNSGETVCDKEFNCENFAGDETVCTQCGGEWTITRNDAYNEPVYSFFDQVVSSSKAVASYRLDRHNADFRCGGYSCSSYGCYYYNYYGCQGEHCTGYSCAYGRSYYSAEYYTSSIASYKTVYSVDVPAYYSITAYNLIPETYNTSCPGGSAETACLSYKFTATWDCWYDATGNPYNDECNANGTATKTSCDLKKTDALEDCNLEGKGTSCASWAIIKGNMIYLDGKEVSW